MPSKILILDFGSQYTMLIARRIRELNVYCEIHPYNIPVNDIDALDPDGIILSGGPASVLQNDSPKINKMLFELGVPILGICYGMQLITQMFGGKVEKAEKREYGISALYPGESGSLFRGFRFPLSIGNSPGHVFINHHKPAYPNQVWMSHGDHISNLPDNFIVTMYSDNSIAAIENMEKEIFGIQFHPEVVHTPFGIHILKNFIFDICKANADWTPQSFIESSIEKIRTKVGKDKVILGLSGGVDSAVAAELLRRAIGDQLIPIFIDNGLLREFETEEVTKAHPNAICVEASEKFLLNLKDVDDPEYKRKQIGRVFVSVFEDAMIKYADDAKFLAQGTLYPDVIESISFKGPSATIKSHHNVGGLPETMQLELLEPFRELFKDEVREIGRRLGVPESIINRQPFPGPGLAVRILGPVDKIKLAILRRADAIVRQEIEKHEIVKSLWQYFAVLLPTKSVGVMGDERTYEDAIAIRIVESQDGMTADWAHIPYELLQQISTRIINEVKGVNRVVYDISSKPPSTIEWL